MCVGNVILNLIQYLDHLTESYQQADIQPPS
jgi:hypothetical protein